MGNELMVKSERKEYIDVARGIAMILVVVGHLGMNNSLTQFIYSFHMPLFFFITGMTMALKHEDRYKVFISKRISSLLIPYFIAACAFSDGSNEAFAYIAYGSRSSISYANSFTPLWFLPCLFVSSLIFEAILGMWRSVRGGYRIVIGLLFLILVAAGWIANFAKPEIGFPYNIDVACVALPFLLVGFFLEKKKWKSNTKWRITFFLILIGMLLTLYNKNLPDTLIDDCPRVAMSTSCYGNLYLFYICGIIGSIMVLDVSFLLQDNRFLREFGKCTMLCLITHGMIIAVVRKVASLFGIGTLLSNCFAVIVTLLVSIPVNRIVRYFCPNIIGAQSNGHMD